MSYNLKSVVVILMALVLFLPMRVLADSLEPSGAPGSTMSNIESIYNQNQEILNNLNGALECPTAPTPKTGQMISEGERDDGALRLGVPLTDSNRFSDNGNGTITDNLTGLIWLRYASILGRSNWEDAITLCNNLSEDDYPWLTDGSLEGDWRLPNRSELKSLRDLNYYNPCVSNQSGTAKWAEGNIFYGIQSDKYWTSSTYLGGTDFAWIMNFNEGEIHDFRKEWPLEDVRPFVWPVRGGYQ
ncbi:MAG: DUF1566 domain-containing protein [Proteobacteria bacterium]|nr:DUF1566 domain-containing protein [Pseudomonadota bacterium]MBU1389241.1 DUF1566 domain-containing protein [Pseudomonadota bacterium]MBU1544061.1 DUF1566 domain-containing protein [Pseudomonadota bacterium]MBU2482041.1 DUF1566 domain-containing protein [Pseudomonadota bacterium]